MDSMFIYEQDMILLRLLDEYLTPAPRIIVGVEDLLLDS
jgi:hypothetical protein